MATSFGVMLGVAWPIGLLSMLTWLATALLFRYSSLAAMAAMGAAPVICLFLGRADAFLFLLALAILVFFKHAPNIRRLRQGTEPKIGKGR